MTAATTLSSDPGESWSERCFDLLRGASVLTGNDVLQRLAVTVSRFPEAELHVAFNHRQVASKMWARDEFSKAYPEELGRAWIVGGWYGVLAALLFADPRIKLREIESIDIDPSVAAIAMSLNEPQVAERRFVARTADMYQLNYAATGCPDIVINTSCEHIPDLRGWLRRIPKGTRVLLQSNDYFAVQEHVSAQPSLNAFEQAADLSQIDFAGSLYLRKYTRFMLIGRV